MSEEHKPELEGQEVITGFGITSETKSSNFTPLKVATKLTTPNPIFPYGWEFPIARLVNVVDNPAHDTKNGKKAVLQFIFRDKDGSQHNHIEWEQDPTDNKFKEKMNGLNIRIKHIYTEVFGNFPKEGIGVGASNFAEYFKAISNAFNSVVDGDGKKVYATRNYFYKLIYFNGNLGFPLSPNFICRVENNKACNLNINLKYDEIESKESNRGHLGGSLGSFGAGMDAPSDLPSFEEGFN